MRSGIHLPVVERLRVVNYPLYPGSAKQGLDLEFDKGVTVIAGINGIGKTTLLNLLLRMVIGPTSPSKAATRDMGQVSKRSLVTARKFSYFQDRAGVTLAANATATLTFRIAGKQVVITRRLTTLEITKLVISGKPVATPDNKTFLDQMAELAGLVTAYDFHMVVRYVQFFTEERLPLLWSPTAQLELFKMLFVDETIGAKLNKLYSEIQATDSEYRNRLFQHNARKKRYEDAQAKLQGGDATLTQLTSQLEVTKRELDKANHEHRAAAERVTDLGKQRDEVDRTIEALQEELDKQIYEFSHQDAAYIVQALPTLDDKYQMLLQGHGANLGCFVCGKGGKRESANIRKRVRNHHCFVCDASLAKVSDPTPIAVAAIRKIEQAIDALRVQIKLQQASEQQLDQDYAAALTAMRPFTQRRHELAMRAEQLQAQLPEATDPHEMPLLADLDAEQLELTALAQKRTDLSEKAKRQIDKLFAGMKEVEHDLGSRLKRYAEAFLHETILVRFQRNAQVKLATGAPKISLPVFRIAMTSSTHLAVHERATATSVSESQKEFLDLAFRMTLLDLIAKDGATMLVMETPEASLDSWFMARAAKMIRQFAPVEGERILIATSNINGTTMIPALLGLLRKDGTSKKLPKAQEHRLIDLMALAEEPGVLKQDEARELLAGELGVYLGR